MKLWGVALMILSLVVIALSTKALTTQQDAITSRDSTITSLRAQVAARDGGYERRILYTWTEVAGIGRLSGQRSRSVFAPAGTGIYLYRVDNGRVRFWFPETEIVVDDTE